MRKQRPYLTDILERIRRIEHATDAGREAFVADVLRQDAVIRNFEVIGEIVKRLSPDLTAAHPTIPWRQIAGFRDVLIHDYEQVDIEAVWRGRRRPASSAPPSSDWRAGWAGQRRGITGRSFDAAGTSCTRDNLAGWE